MEIQEIRQRVKTSREISEFQRRVYLALLDVPRGETISYKQLSERIGCRSAQAIGQALKRNPFAPDVPCHRVIASDGSLGGFHGQREGEMLEKKRALLRSEMAVPSLFSVAEIDARDCQPAADDGGKRDGLSKQ